jgi:hypothetical protein
VEAEETDLMMAAEIGTRADGITITMRAEETDPTMAAMGKTVTMADRQILRRITITMGAEETDPTMAAMGKTVYMQVLDVCRYVPASGCPLQALIWMVDHTGL